MTVFSLDDKGNLWAAGSAAAGPYLLAVEVSDNGFQVQRQTVSVVVNIQAAVSVTVARSIPHNLRVQAVNTLWARRRLLVFYQVRMLVRF